MSTSYWATSQSSIPGQTVHSLWAVEQLAKWANYISVENKTRNIQILQVKNLQDFFFWFDYLGENSWTFPCYMYKCCSKNIMGLR